MPSSCSRVLIGLVALGAATTTSVLVAGSASSAPLGVKAADATLAAVAPESSEGTRIRIVQANLESPQAAAGFAADARTTLAQRPDFITYNEVAYRQSSVLAPTGYQLYRAPDVKNPAIGDKYQGETPVAWDSTKWKAVATGTWMVSNSTAKTAAQKVQLGMRYANWATLADASGRRVSVVSVHTAPKTYPVEELVGPSVERVGLLVDKLAADGPVLVGGDFNMQYKGARYQRDTLTAHGLVPTFDSLGTSTPTHDAGGTVDFLFVRSAKSYSVDRQYTLDLNSDHKLLGADVTLPLGTPATSASGTTTTPAAIRPSVTVNRAAPRPGTVVRQAVGIIDRTPAGAAVHLASKNFSGRELVAALLRADRRGVDVHVLTGSRRPSTAQVSLRRALGQSVRSGSWAVNRPDAWGRQHLPAASVMASRSANTPAVRMTLSAPMTTWQQKHRVRSVVTTDLRSYNSLFSRFMASVGR